jgi:CRP-like cAMP-binding protein
MSHAVSAMIRIPRREPSAKLHELSTLQVFAGLSGKHLQQVASNLDEASVPAGEVLIHEGRHNDTFWIILEGEAELTIGGRAREVVSRGGIVGLPSMFTGREANANVVAVTDVSALVASHAQFNALIGDPEIEIRFKAAVFDRLRDELYQLTHGGTAKPGARKKGSK